ncbi:hypothetical protein [Amycolatopsis nivea]|uniref:hypothetical protein n=1 Tax=Amycolatopsis nivea TaxID=1644109 RepID=UPI00106F7416|nr:hypothetical protein [Amycolatopsis nivea]
MIPSIGRKGRGLVGADPLARVMAIFGAVISFASLIVSIANYRRGARRIEVAVTAVDIRTTHSMDRYRPFGDVSGTVRVSNHGPHSFPIKKISIVGETVEIPVNPREMDEDPPEIKELRIISPSHEESIELRSHGSITQSFKFVSQVETNLSRYKWYLYPSITLENGEVIAGPSFLKSNWPADWVKRL